jgi:nitrite reductase/ring-hydroxylating ferredoxin subunit
MIKVVDVATLSDLPPGACLSVEASGVLIALFNVEGRIFATANTCPHAGGPLGEGLLHGEVVECPWHGWRFNVRTGVRPENPDFTVPTYEVQIEGDRIRVAVPLP